RWSEALCAPSQSLEDDEQFNEAIAKDRAELRRRLLEICTRRELRDALFVASPDLDASLRVWQREPESARGQRLERALVRYLSRMAGRATPFGLFAGCSVGEIRARTRLVLGNIASYRRHTRLDLGYLVSLTDALIQNYSFREYLQFRPNNSLYRVAGRTHYVEAKLNNGARAHNLVAIEALVATLDGHPDASHTAKRLETCRAQLAAIDAVGVGVPPERYREIARTFDDLPVKWKLSRLFQVDMFKPAPAVTLGKAPVREILTAVDVLHRLSWRRDEALKQFRQAC